MFQWKGPFCGFSSQGSCTQPDEIQAGFQVCKCSEPTNGPVDPFRITCQFTLRILLVWTGSEVFY